VLRAEPIEDDMPETKTPTQDKYALRSVGRALDVLEALGSGDKEGLTVAEIAEAIGVSKSTAFTLLQALQSRSYVTDVRLGGSRRYRLGFALVHLGDRAGAEVAISQLAFPILKQLTVATGLTSRLAILDEGYAVSLSRVDAPGIFRLTSSLGRRELPHCSAVGKALLALLPPAKTAQILKKTGMPRRTEHTIVDPVALMQDLIQVADRGYAFDDEEDNPGVFCVAAAVTDLNGDGVAAISVTGIKSGRNQDALHELGKVVQDFAAQISRMVAREN
jgi:IclR family acetate operon transcriptional repressor